MIAIICKQKSSFQLVENYTRHVVTRSVPTVKMATGGAAPRPEDMLRILIATDNHLGYADKQPEKEDDSFDTFEEIMQIAKREDVDFVLLGGDLFHENKPTRQSELKAFQVIRFMNCK